MLVPVEGFVKNVVGHTDTRATELIDWKLVLIKLSTWSYLEIRMQDEFRV